MKKKLPKNNKEWSNEIIAAYKDAAETKPVGEIMDIEINDDNMFLLAPLVCLKFRGLPYSKENQKMARDAALSSVVATESDFGKLDTFSKFSLAYITSHLGLNLCKEIELYHVMEYLDDNKEKLKKRLKH